MTEPIINNINGQLRLSNDFIVSSQTRTQEIVDYFGESNIVINDVNTGWKNHSISKIKINELNLTITFYFNKDILKMLNLIINDKGLIKSSWEDWDKDKELNQKEYFNDWLTSQIGRKRQFSWGKIEAIYDNKSGASSIVLNY